MTEDMASHRWEFCMYNPEVGDGETWHSGENGVYGQTDNSGNDVLSKIGME
jgi:hypothetical protein